MRITKNGVVKMRDRLVARKLLIKNKKGHLKTGVAYNSVYRLGKNTYNSVTNRTTKYNDSVQLSGTKNNNRITIDNRETKSKNNELINQALKTRDFSILKPQSVL